MGTWLPYRKQSAVECAQAEDNNPVGSVQLALDDELKVGLEMCC
jgi:hypothetical protein